MAATREAKVKLSSARREAKIREIVDMELIKNDAEAVLLTSLLKAYGDSVGFLYYSPGRAKGTERPPDAVLCTPEVGVLIIDAKDHTIDGVDHVEAGHVFLKYQGRTHPKNVIQQVENQMFEIRSDALKIIRNEHRLPLMNAMVAFPNISESEWVARGYDKNHPMGCLLFKDQIESKSRLKQRIDQLVRDTLKIAHKPVPLDVEQVDSIYKVFGNSSTINDNRPIRTTISEDTLGAYIDEIAALDKYLSREQEDLSRMAFDDSPRVVRGVAGSGKSVVLANVVARYLHRRLNSLELPTFSGNKFSIAVTCYNRALVDFLKQRIRLSYREQTLTENIPSSILTVVHLNSLMYTMIHDFGWPLQYILAGDIKEMGITAWAENYRKQINEFAKAQPEFYNSTCFDAIFIDEGQDFEPEEYRLILDLIRPNEVSGEKPVLIFYDDAQNVYGRARPVWTDIGLNLGGARSSVMLECFRNTRQIVELAFNVLLGSQAAQDQKVQTRTYADINYLKQRGVIEETGDHIRVRFAEREYKRPDIHKFTDRGLEISWLADEITRLIQVESVRPEDMLVIFYKQFLFPWEALRDQIIKQIPGQEFVFPSGKTGEKDTYIFQKGKLTITNVYGAKGYDAPLVFLVGTDGFTSDKEGRAAFYVGATRAKLHLYVSGLNINNSLLTEAESVSKLL
jgi:superfamily I DNA and RNA helicase